MPTKFGAEPLRTICESAACTPRHGALLAQLRDAAPEFAFAVALECGGWHRPSGIVRPDGTRVAPHLRNWAERELAELEPGDAIPDAWSDYLATRLDGTTVYFVATTGSAHWDFVQLELEMVVEVVDRPLFAAAMVPNDLEAFLDPLEVEHLEPRPLAPPRYICRSFHHVALLRRELGTAAGANRRFARFVEDWSRSRAGGAARLCDHWVLRLFRFVDRFGEPKTEATPLPRRPTPPLAHGDAPAGSALAERIADFDRQVGYPMAWYFEMLTRQKHLHDLAERVYRDHAHDGYCYLGDKDLAVVVDWFREPYCF